MKLATASLLVLTLGCATSSQKSTTSDIPDWNLNMLHLASEFSTVLPWAISQQSQKDEILTSLQSLAQATESIHKTTLKPNTDHGLNIVTVEFASHIHEALRAYEQKDYRQAKQKIRSSGRYCISCHTFAETDKEPTYSFGSENNLKGLTYLERGDFWVATRKFQNAMLEYEKALADKIFQKESPQIWIQYFEKLLALTIRVKNDPYLSLEFVSRYLDTKDLPAPIKTALTRWRSDIKTWQSDLKDGAFSNKTNKEKLNEVSRLVGIANKNKSKNSNLVIIMRASLGVHDLLSRLDQNGPKDFRLQTFYYAGITSQLLESTGIANLAIGYFDECAHTGIGTSTGKMCLSEMEKIIDKRLEKGAYTTRSIDRLNYLKKQYLSL